jgi:nucleotide-binding universal stress UspA family protein
VYTKILIPLDGSKTAEKVLPYARLLAGEKTPVELLAVIDVATLATHMSANNARYFDSLINAEASGSKSYLEGVAATFEKDTSVKCSVERGKPEEVIIEKAASDKNILVAIATHGRSGVKRWLLGSVAEKVLRGTTNPLFVVRADDLAKAEGKATLRSIVVPLDGSELAESVLPSVGELAKKLKMEIIVTRVYEFPVAAYYGSDAYYAPSYEDLSAQLREDARVYLEKKVEELRSTGLEKVSFVLLEGPSANEIITLARKTPDNLVAMCTHGRSGVKRWILGSVTEKVVRHSGDPVLVVRAASGGTHFTAAEQRDIGD